MTMTITVQMTKRKRGYNKINSRQIFQHCDEVFGYKLEDKQLLNNY